MASIQSLIQSDPERLNVLRAVASLDLPDCYVAAGFVRNMVWDYLRSSEHTLPNDIDGIVPVPILTSKLVSGGSGS